MFKKDILSNEGELPKVFRMGLLWSDSASSLSKLLNELGKTKGRIGNSSVIANETQGFEEEEKLINEELWKMKNPGSGNTSENNSLMGDTPSNYNEANLRFHSIDPNKKQTLD